jgi:HAD superfamily hydrolase (TIGR01548 family)
MLKGNGFIIREACHEFNLNLKWPIMKYPSPAPLDILVFDMDGVLIDVSESYRKTIAKTVQTYLETCLGFKKGSVPLITGEHIASFKVAGGFNNDWDLTCGLLLFLLSISGFPPLSRRKSFVSIEEVSQYLRSRSSGFHSTLTGQTLQNHFTRFVGRVKSCGGGLKGVQRTLRKTRNASWDGWVYHSGEIDTMNVIKRIFQERYLGRQFVRCYSLRPLFYHGRGDYLRERLLIPRRLLASLRRKTKLGIASGRPRFEAELALRGFKLKPYFESMVTLDECQREEDRILKKTGKKVKRTKPHPFPLLRVIREIGLPHPRSAYVGDVVDDLQAARSAGRKDPVVPIGFVFRSGKEKSLADSLRKAGAHFVIQQPKDLLRLVS